MTGIDTGETFATNDKPENPQLKIKGYRKLTDTEISLINTCKAMGDAVGALVDKVDDFPGIDKRWLAIAKTDLQKGFMSLIRSIAQPESF